MNKRVRNILNLAILALLITGFAVVAVLCREDGSKRKCHSVLISMAEPYRFITEEDIRGKLDREYGECLGIHTDSLRLDEIENIIDSDGAVKKSQAYVSDDGVLHIHITQRDPFVRFQNGSKGFYADREGYIFPLQAHYSAQVSVVDGCIPVNVPDGYKGKARSGGEREWINGIISLLDYMGGTVWEKNIVQIHVDEKGQLIMIPGEGKERFVFGKAEEFGIKFGKMEDYYAFIKPHKEYSLVNVSFDGQIVCR